MYKLKHGRLALDGRLVRKISKCNFYQDIKNSSHGLTQIGARVFAALANCNIGLQNIIRFSRQYHHTGASCPISFHIAVATVLMDERI